MEPHSTHDAMNLPPVPEAASSSAPNTEPAGGINPEIQAAAAEAIGAKAPSAAPSTAVPAPAPFSVPNLGLPATTNVSTTTNTAAPSIADDGDLIEKEWVVRAKQIVNQTRENPYEQSKAMTNLKVDYMQKRYQKTIKVSE